ncbi:MAG TPA: aldehyde ferredoxin oxidoreductase family protein [Chloroflexota bacterium]|nr:aldehyde ferredoxin oxidoreductase family protein [Chloroflexota bacterium]
MNDLHGYHGRLLLVDLSAASWREEAIPPHVLRAFVGGAGLASYLLYRFAPAGVEPLSPANPLIFVNSPLVGTAVTTSSKYTVITKSPLTGFIGDSLSSSYLAVELKKTGYDAIVLTGAAPDWSYLEIGNGGVRFHDAAPLLGLDPGDTQAKVRELRGDPYLRVAAIGLAGERLVRYATISNDGRHAGRTGTGAVMGAKRLKALAVRGHIRTAVAQPRELQAVRKRLVERSLGHATEKYRGLGTTANLSVFNRLGALPSYNFRQSTFEAAEQVSGEQLHEAHHVRSVTCAACTIGCEHLFRFGDKTARLEYESQYALGPLCGISDLNVVLEAAALCDRYGMDTISAGATVAWAMESAQQGLLDVPGLRFGRGEALLAALEAIARRQGVGELLADGSLRAAQQTGGGSEAWAMQVKGLEMPGYEPRSLKTMALGLAVGSRGACHNRSTAYEADFSDVIDRLHADGRRGQIAADSEDRSAVIDSLILCKFVRHCFEDFYPEAEELHELVTGWHVDLRQAGERITNLKKLFNIREGWQPADDTLPPRVLTESLPTGVAAGATLTAPELQEMIASYYAARAWTPEGAIPDGKLADLGLTGLLTAWPAQPPAR